MFQGINAHVLFKILFIFVYIYNIISIHLEYDNRKKDFYAFFFDDLTHIQNIYNIISINSHVLLRNSLILERLRNFFYNKKKSQKHAR